MYIRYDITSVCIFFFIIDYWFRTFYVKSRNNPSKHKFALSEVTSEKLKKKLGRNVKINVTVGEKLVCVKWTRKTHM